MNSSAWKGPVDINVINRDSRFQSRLIENRNRSFAPGAVIISVIKYTASLLFKAAGGFIECDLLEIGDASPIQSYTVMIAGWVFISIGFVIVMVSSLLHRIRIQSQTEQ